MNLVYGVDVSHYQGKIDWKLALSLGKIFSVAKESDGGSKAEDSMHDAHQAGAKAAGVTTGSYHFFRFDPDPVEQAELFMALSGGHPLGDIPLCADIEWDNQSKNPLYRDSAHGGKGSHMDEEAALRALTFLEYIEKHTGRTPMMYTSPGFFYGFTKPERFARFPLWEANYVSSPEKIKKVAPWAKATFWQYNDDTTINGVQKIDGDAFLGSPDEFYAFVGGKSPVPAPAPTPAPVSALDLSRERVMPLQQAVNGLGYSPSLLVDGLPGKLTKTALMDVAGKIKG